MLLYPSQLLDERNFARLKYEYSFSFLAAVVFSSVYHFLGAHYLPSLNHVFFCPKHLERSFLFHMLIFSSYLSILIFLVVLFQIEL